MRGRVKERRGRRVKRGEERERRREEDGLMGLKEMEKEMEKEINEGVKGDEREGKIVGGRMHGKRLSVGVRKTEISFILKKYESCVIRESFCSEAG